MIATLVVATLLALALGAIYGLGLLWWLWAEGRLVRRIVIALCLGMIGVTLYLHRRDLTVVVLWINQLR